MNLHTVYMAIIPLTMLSIPLVAAPIDTLLNDYSEISTAPFSAERGQQLWMQEFPHTESNTVRSCAACHTNELFREGKHIRTKKIIDPLAPSVNSTRLTDVKKVKKWLKRNCKWTLGRECTAQEKGDFITFIQAK